MSKLKNRITVGLLTLSTSGLIAISQHEGFRSEAYIPTKGDVPTIGFGSTKGVKMGDTITKKEALKRLMYDSQTAQKAIRHCVRVPLSQGEYDAFSSFAFNVGESAFCGSTLVKKLNRGDYEGACRELLRWDKKTYYDINGEKRTVTLKGLTKRRQDEFKRCMQN